MITREVNKFMLLAPLMLPKLIDCKKCQLLLYHGTKKESPRIHHCCFFASPKTGQSMYKINVTTDSREFVKDISVTIFDSIDVWEDELETDLNTHSGKFDFIVSLSHQELLSIFCKLGYES